MIVALIGIEFVDLDLSQHQYLFAAFVFANPVFIYLLSFFFKKDSSGSLFIKLFYVLAGGIGPLVIVIL